VQRPDGDGISLIETFCLAHSSGVSSSNRTLMINPLPAIVFMGKNRQRGSTRASEAAS
jgi:hypothetical protein